MNAVMRSPQGGSPEEPHSPPSRRAEDYPAWREGLLVGLALLALTLLQYWHLAFH